MNLEMIELFRELKNANNDLEGILRSIRVPQEHELRCVYDTMSNINTTIYDGRNRLVELMMYFRFTNAPMRNIREDITRMNGGYVEDVINQIDNYCESLSLDIPGWDIVYLPWTEDIKPIINRSTSLIKEIMLLMETTDNPYRIYDKLVNEHEEIVSLLGGLGSETNIEEMKCQAEAIGNILNNIGYCMDRTPIDIDGSRSDKLNTHNDDAKILNRYIGPCGVVRLAASFEWSFEYRLRMSILIGKIIKFVNQTDIRAFIDEELDSSF